MRISIAIIIILTVYSTAFGRQLSPEEALQRIQNSNSVTRTAKIKSNRKTGTKLAHSAKGGEYFVFNMAGGGYVVASGDDRAEGLLAEVPDGNFNIDSIPPAAKWWLEEYTRQINSLRSAETTKTAVYTTENDIATLYAQWHPIAPLMTCIWDQTPPYNKYCPEKNGRTSMTGCVATAMAQMIRTIGYAKGNGYKSDNTGDALVEFNYTDYNFNLNNLPDISSFSTATSEQIDAVGQLMLACGLSVNMNYSPSASSAYSSYVAAGLKENFGYSDYTELFNRSNFSNAEWESIIYRELQLGRPVYYSGNNGSTGHAFVVDGYYGHGLYHINWGWGGLSNGYYRLSALSPGQQGTGGSSSGNGYNFNQEVIKAVPPECDPGIIPITILGSFAQVSDGVYSIFFKSSIKPHYNTTLGVVFIDDNGKKVAQVIFWRGQNVPANGSVYMSEYQREFTECSLSSGNYRIYPAVGINGSNELGITGPYEGKNYYVNLTIDDHNNYSYSNSGTTISVPDLHISDIEDTELKEFQSKINFTLVNNGSADFTGDLTLGLVPYGETDYICSTRITNVSVPAKYNSSITKKLILFDSQYNDISPGTYHMVIKDSDDNIIDPEKQFDIHVCEFSRLGWIKPTHFYIDNIDEAPSYIITGEKWEHDIFIHNDDERNVKLELQFFQPGTNIKVKSYPVFTGTLPVMDAHKKIAPPIIDLPFGIYEMAYVETRTEISNRKRIKICDIADGLYYMPMTDRDAAVDKHPQYAYKGDVVIPSEITLNEKKYRITSLSPNAFSESPYLESVEVPESVRNIGVNAFASCVAMEHIILHADTIPFTYRNHIAPGLNDATEIYVPETVYSTCQDIMKGYHTVYALIDSIESINIEPEIGKTQTSLKISPAHGGTNREYTVIPIANGMDPAAEVTLHSIESGRIVLDITAHHAGTADFQIHSAQPGLAPANVSVSVQNSARIDDISVDHPDENEVNYDISGRKINTEAKRRGQIIISVTPHGARKRIVNDDM